MMAWALTCDSHVDLFFTLARHHYYPYRYGYRHHYGYRYPYHYGYRYGYHH